jgi:hypothetical protein
MLEVGLDQAIQYAAAVGVLFGEKVGRQLSDTLHLAARDVLRLRDERDRMMAERAEDRAQFDAAIADWRVTLENTRDALVALAVDHTVADAMRRSRKPRPPVSDEALAALTLADEILRSREPF